MTWRGYVVVQRYPFGSSSISMARASQEGDTLIIETSVLTEHIGPASWYEAVAYGPYGTEIGRFVNRHPPERTSKRPPRKEAA